VPDSVVVEGLPALRGAVGSIFAAVGVFDGLHRGHGYLVRRLVRQARLRGAHPTVITFDHHPDEIIRGVAPPLLLDPGERIARLSRAGVEVIVVVHFDDELRRTSYIDFVDALRARVRVAGFLMTAESAFGHERRGTPDSLRRLGAERDFEVVVVEPLTIDGRPVSSSAIRAAIAGGDLRAAGRLLGRRVAVTGEVDPGARRALTFNPPVALPPTGRYRAVVGPPIEVGAMSWGGLVRRTVRVGTASVELDAAGPHGARIRVAFRT